MKRKNVNNRGTYDAFGLLLLLAFAMMTILSAGLTSLALLDGQSSEIIAHCLIATGSWAALWTAMNCLRGNRGVSR